MFYNGSLVFNITFRKESNTQVIKILRYFYSKDRYSTSKQQLRDGVVVAVVGCVVRRNSVYSSGLVKAGCWVVVLLQQIAAPFIAGVHVFNTQLSGTCHDFRCLSFKATRVLTWVTTMFSVAMTFLLRSLAFQQSVKFWTCWLPGRLPVYPVWLYLSIILLPFLLIQHSFLSTVRKYQRSSIFLDYRLLRLSITVKKQKTTERKKIQLVLVINKKNSINR